MTASGKQLGQWRQADSGISVRAPPRIEEQSPQTVWFHIPPTGAPQKLVLTCVAAGDPGTEDFVWFKDGSPLVVDGERVIWQRPGVSGTLVFLRPSVDEQGSYQCHVRNIFGTALSNVFQVQLGLLEHFSQRPMKTVHVKKGDSLTLPCTKPHGVPPPSIFWVFRNTKQSWVIETIQRRHITVDGDGALQFAFVEEHDGRENLVYQCAATSPVLQGEYRAGDEYILNVTSGRKSPNIQSGPNLKPALVSGMMYKPPRKLWFSPELVKVTAGEELRLSCIFSGSPLPEVRWWRKGDKELPTRRLTREDFGKTLLVTPVSSDDAGTYVCQAGPVKHHIRVQVTAAPHWLNHAPQDTSPAEADTAELRCDATGHPEPLIRWFINGRPLSQVAENSRRRVLEEGRLLRIERLDHDVDIAVYQCNASNPLGYKFANAYINVQGSLPPLAYSVAILMNSDLVVQPSSPSSKRR